MSKSDYYDGTRLLSLQDANGNKPEIFICVGNRTAGKTIYFTRLCIRRFIDRKEKFAFIYRFNYELDDCADKIFKDVKALFFPNMEMTSERRAHGIYHELFLDGESCGYAISINQSDPLKRYAHLFSDIERILFDEFQSESSHYCTDEVKKFISLHTSIARGGGKSVRYVPVYMLANPVSLLNPYYIALGITDRLKSDTKFMRGNGWVFENTFNENASVQQLESGFNKAFSSQKYVSYAASGVYLNDNTAFIEKPSGRTHYLCTIKYDGRNYGIREYPDLGIVYCDDKPDKTFTSKISVTTDDHEINYVMLKRNDMFLSNLRYYFEKGCFRFKDLRCKEAVLKALSY